MLVVESAPPVGGYSWHIGVVRRPLTSPPRPLLLSFSTSRSVRLASSSSVSSFDRSFLPRSLSLSLYIAILLLVVCPLPRARICTLAWLVTMNARMNAYTCARAYRSPTPPSAACTPLCLFASARSDPAPRRSLRPAPLDRAAVGASFPSPLAPLSFSVPFPDAAAAATAPGGCYDLHSSRNKTSATLLSRSTINETVLYKVHYNLPHSRR